MRGNIKWYGANQVGPGGARGGLPQPDPPLAARDEAIFLLHTAAEIEHSLMVQYLYAAMTLDLGTEQKSDPDTTRWQRIILGVAKEEMGHFITVQNILRLIGGPLNFEREDTPFRSEYYPFPFSLRPLTIKAPVKGEWEKAGSLNRYIAAEMPPIKQIRKRRDRRDVAEVLGCRNVASLRARAKKLEINQVGLLYARLIEIFSDRQKLRDEDFLAAEDIEGYLADAPTWDRAGEDFNVLVLPTGSRREAIVALKEIAEQGEGQGPKRDDTSHFQKFLKIYRGLRERQEANRNWKPALPVPQDPTSLAIPENRTQRKIQDKELAEKRWTRITHPASRLWVQLFDLRYRMTLGLIMHQMLLDANRGPDSEMARRALANAAITEMHSLGWIARAIVTRPLTPAAREKKRAAPAFELPYTFAFPDREADRARVHLAVLGAVKLLVEKLRETDKKMSKDEKELLHWLALRDLTLERLCDEIASKKVKWCKCPEKENEEEQEEETV
jgi:Ferritin-like